VAVMRHSDDLVTSDVTKGNANCCIKWCTTMKTDGIRQRRHPRMKSHWCY